MIAVSKMVLPKSTPMQRWEVAPHGTLVDIGPSKIEGKGCFAAEDLYAGQIIGLYEGRLGVAGLSKFSLHCEAVEGGPAFCIDGSGPLRFINHDEDPNAEVSGVFVYAAKTMPAGTELTLHYGDDFQQELEI